MQRDAKEGAQRHIDRHRHTGDRATHDHPLLMKFDLPRAAIGARVGGRKALRQSKGVEPRVAARPGER
jgi:hypothetical protein